MNVKDGVKALKNELRNYNYNRKKYYKISELIDDMWYEIAGVKAIDPSKVTLENHNQALSEERRLDLLEKIEKYEIERRRIEIQLNYVEHIIEQIEDDMKEPIKDIYIYGHTFQYASMKYDLYCSYLQYRIDKNLMDIIKKEGGI